MKIRYIDSELLEQDHSLVDGVDGILVPAALVPGALKVRSTQLRLLGKENSLPGYLSGDADRHY